jgi:uncharacterized protein YqjF (DUF2071 family)
MTPFSLERPRPIGTPPLPGLSSMPETNVRTYVRGPDGRSGIWFFSLDIATLVVAAAGHVYASIPYRWSRMRFEHDGAELRYRGARRRGPGTYDIAVRVGARIGADAVTDLEHFLTGRWRLSTRYGPVAASIPVEHPPWPLHRATVLRLEQTLLEADGLPRAEGTPLVHASPGVAVRIGLPEIVHGRFGRTPSG